MTDYRKAVSPSELLHVVNVRPEQIETNQSNKQTSVQTEPCRCE